MMTYRLRSDDMTPETILFVGSLLLPATVFAAGVAVLFVETKRVGGLLFWRLGRLGGSFYIARVEG